MSDFVLFFLPSIIAAIVAAAFTWWFGIRAERRHRASTRALLSIERIHNATTLKLFQTMFEDNLRENKFNEALTSFELNRGMFAFERQRWDSTDVGDALGVEELLRYGEWYFALGTFIHIIESSMDASLALARTPATDETMRARIDLAARVLGDLVAKATKLQKDAPALLDKRFTDSDAARDYMREATSRNEAPNLPM